MAECEDKRCLRCGYILDHLPAPRCPECGLEFDPDQPATYRHPQPRRSALPYFIAACLSGLMLLIGYYLMPGQPLMSDYRWASIPDWIAPINRLVTDSRLVRALVDTPARIVRPAARSALSQSRPPHSGAGDQHHRRPGDVLACLMALDVTLGSRCAGPARWRSGL